MIGRLEEEVELGQVANFVSIILKSATPEHVANSFHFLLHPLKISCLDQ